MFSSYCLFEPKTHRKWTCVALKKRLFSLSLTRSPQTKIYYCYIICKTRISLMKSDNYWAIRWFVLYGVFIGQACSMLNALTFSCQHIAQQLDNGLAHNKHSCIFASNMYWHSNYEHKDQISLDRSRWVPFCVRRYWTCVCVCVWASYFCWPPLQTISTNKRKCCYRFPGRQWVEMTNK